jgi:FAD/FMN-containing dehydrogenase
VKTKSAYFAAVLAWSIAGAANGYIDTEAAIGYGDSQRDAQALKDMVACTDFYYSKENAPYFQTKDKEQFSAAYKGVQRYLQATYSHFDADNLFSSGMVYASSAPRLESDQEKYDRAKWCRSFTRFLLDTYNGY